LRVSSIASFAIGVQMLRTNPMRTVLSTLGIIIGVAALVAILALGDGLEQFSRQQIEETTDLQMIQVQPRTTDLIEGVLIRRDSVPALTTAHALDLTRQLGPRASATLAMAASLIVRLPGDSVRHAAVVTGFGPATPTGTSDSLDAGRWLADDDVTSSPPVALLGRKLAGQISGDPNSLIGSDILIGEQRRIVVGIVGGPSASRLARVYVPLGPADLELLEGGGRSPSLLIRARSVEDIPAVEAETRTWLETRFGNADRDFTVASNRGRVDQVRQAFLVFRLALGAITGIAILVGGIGIMNVLLASVQERTREIGVRRSAGARQRDIFLQFLAESVAISGIGSFLGAGPGVVGAWVITAGIRGLTEAPVHPAFTWVTLVVATAAAVFVGIAFGSYPARHAARLSPIEAIRHE
jgi:putative ABC transport system permease protein